MENKVREKLIDNVIDLIVDTFESQGVRPTIASVERILEDVKQTLSWTPVNREVIAAQKERISEFLDDSEFDPYDEMTLTEFSEADK